MKKIDKLNQFIGEKVAWLNLAMVILTFCIVVFRYAFGLSWVWVQELVIYMHAIIFMTAVGFSLQANEHVKVDILYTKMDVKKKAVVDMFGVLIFLFPFCILMFYQSLPYVQQSWRVFERSGDANGLPGIFALKTLLIVYPLLLGLQGFSLLLTSLQNFRGERG